MGFPLQGSVEKALVLRAAGMTHDVDQDEDDGCANNLPSRYADARGNMCYVDISVTLMGLG